MFYEEFGFRAYQPKRSTRLALFDLHYDECVGSVVVRVVPMSAVVWC